MRHARESLVYFFRELVAQLGRNGTITLLLGLSVVFLLALCLLVFAFYLLLQFSEATFHSIVEAIGGILKAIWWHPRQMNISAIRLELYFDAAFLLIALISLAALVGHGIIPWVKEHSEQYLLYALVSSLVLFAFFAHQSLRIANRFPIPKKQ